MPDESRSRYFIYFIAHDVTKNLKRITNYKHINKQTFKQTILLTRTMPIAAEVSVTGVEYYESASESDYYYESTSDSDCDCVVVSSVSEYRKSIARKNPEATALTVRKGAANSVGYHSAWESILEDSDSDSRDSDSDFDEEEDYQKFLTRKKAEAIVSSRRPATTPTSRSRLPPTTPASRKTTKDAVSSDSDGSTYDSASYSNSDIDSNSCNGSDRVMLSSAATVVVGPKSVQPRFTSDGKWLSAIVEDQKKQLSMRLKEKEYIETYLLEKQRQHMREQDDTKAKKSKKTEMHPNPKKKINKETNKDKQNKAPEGGKRAANSETQNKWKESTEPATIDDTSVACKANTPQTSIETGPVLGDGSNPTTKTSDLVDGGKLVFAKKSGVRQKLFFWKKNNKKSSDWGGTQNRSTV